ncbi:MAG: hypothetical protein Q9162_007857 [Coniocarpon cinnabarinum]
MLEPASGDVKASLSKAEEEGLNSSLRRLYDDLLPTPASQANRRKVEQKLRSMLREEWPDKNVEVSVFGSSGNLLYTNKSDVDICITMTGIDTVCSLAELLARRGMRGVTCVHAKAVPIVKIWDPELQVACDLNVNNHVALKNTRLVRAYMELDERVRPLAMIIKYWTKRRVLNEASGGTLSSYTWTLLVINFLQRRPAPILPVLPLRDEQDRPRDDFSEDVRHYKDFGKQNSESLGELFFHFFRLYGYDMPYDTAVVSVRKGQLLTKAEKGWVLANNNRLCVEEPFNTDRNLGNTADDTAFRGLHQELRQAFTRIAEAKQLVSGVCEQFEFPVEEHKSIFERPQQGPRPVLSRSTSQSGRGNRGGGNRKGARQPFDQRSGVSVRRSSSAAAFGGNAPQLVLPPQTYYLQQEELQRLSRVLSTKEQQLRLQQAQIMEAQMAGYSQQGATSPAPQPQRPVFGYPSPRPQHAETVPQAASGTASQGYPFPQSYDSAVAMSHTSSQQGTNTNPNSPMLAPMTPNRRSFQRQAVLNSPGAAIRSQSQPARPLQLPLMQQQAARTQYGQSVYPKMQGTPVWPTNLPRPAYYGPIYNSMGVHYLAVPQFETFPREYLGYGIGTAPQFGQFPQAPIYDHAPTFGEQRASEGLASPSRVSSSVSLSAEDQPRTPSPAPPSGSVMEGLHSAPVTATFQRHPPEKQFVTPAPENPVPVVVNGSYPMQSRAQTLDNGESLEQRRTFHSTRFPQAPSDLSLGAFGPLHRNGPPLNFAAEPKLSPLRDEDTPTAENGPANTSPGVTKRPAPRTGPVSSAREVLARSTDDPTQSARFSPESINERRRVSASNKHTIPHLDLANAAVERVRDSAPTTSTALSPVEETRTPSPSNNKKHGGRRSVQLNGVTVPTPPTPMPTRGEMENVQQGGANGAAPKKVKGGGGDHQRSSSLANASASLAPSQVNQWQQASTGKKKNRKGNQPSSPGSERKAGGEPLPANEAARKGG